MNPTRCKSIAACAFAAAVVVLAGCGSSSPGYQPDSGTDTGTEWDLPGDTSPDGYDVPPDFVPDGYDVPPDFVPDSYTDAPPDWYPDSTPDTTPDITPDWYPDTPPDGPPGGGVGVACYSATQCMGVPGSGRTCLTNIFGMLEFPGGYCSGTCTSTADCGTGGACVSLFSYGSYCLKLCSSTSMCRSSEGYSCTSIPGTPGATYCLPPMPSPDGGPIDY